MIVTLAVQLAPPPSRVREQQQRFRSRPEDRPRAEGKRRRPLGRKRDLATSILVDPTIESAAALSLVWHSRYNGVVSPFDIAFLPESCS